MSEIYRAPDATQLATIWGLRNAEREWQSTVSVGDTAPIITRHGLQLAQLGLAPRWSNASGGTTLSGVPIVDASSNSAARNAFERERWCVIPALAFYLARSRALGAGSELWKFSRKDLEGFGIAGLYDRGRTPSDGREVSHFALLTVDCRAHPLLAEFGRVRDARSGVVSSQAPLLLERAKYEEWLRASTAEALRFAEHALTDELTAEPPVRVTLPRSGPDRVPASSGTLVNALSRPWAAAEGLPLISLNS